MPIAADTLLTARSLACRRGERLLWSGLDLTLAAGGAIHVTGANGTGKSSLLRVIAGLLPPAGGDITATADIALIDERPAIDADVSLRRALSFWAVIDKATSDGVAHAIDFAGLTTIADVPMRLFSTGQRKRAAIARLTLQQAAIWLLDEPLNGLDTDGSDRLIHLIDRHRSDGGGVIIASHQPLPVAAITAIRLMDHVP